MLRDPAGFFVCKLKKLDNNKRPELAKAQEQQSEGAEEELQQQEEAKQREKTEKEVKVSFFSSSQLFGQLLGPLAYQPMEEWAAA